MFDKFSDRVVILRSANSFKNVIQAISNKLFFKKSVLNWQGKEI